VTTKAKSSVSVDQQAKGKQRWNGVNKKERSASMSRVVQHRWNGVAQTEQEVQEYFSTVEIGVALETYAVMRKHYETAGKLLDQRIQKENQREVCGNCGKEFSRDVPWYNREPVKDPLTGTVTNVFSCSQACMIALRGRGVKRGSA